MAEKISVSWDDLSSRKVDTRLKEQEALARNRAYAQLDADAVTPQPSARSTSGNIFYNSAVYMALFGLVGGLLAWGVGQVLVYRSSQHADAIITVRNAFLDAMSQQGATLDGYEHCLCHENAVLPAYRGDCACRKPATGMIDAIAARHAIDRSRSWMVGDRSSDIKCGRNAGLRTLAIIDPRTRDSAGDAGADYAVQR